MKRVVATGILMCLSLSWMVPAVFAADCAKCDCIHPPCPPECKPCCILATGKVASKKDDVLEMNGKTFNITKDTKIEGDLTQGSRAKVYFQKSGGKNVVTGIVASQPKATGSAGPN